MSLTDAPAVLTQLSTQLAACVSWPAGATVWYPFAPDGTTGIHAVINRTVAQSSYAAGARPLRGGTLNVSIYAPADAVSMGDLESLAENLLVELMDQAPGIPFRSGECGLCSEPPPAAEAAGGTTVLIAQGFTLPYGLEA